MQCDRCGEREATVHEVVISQGQKVERHLCEQCARDAGLNPTPQAPISQLLSSYILSASSGGTPTLAQPRTLTCDSCSMTFSSFKQSGLLGCAKCYDAFEEPLSPLIARAHDGATHHVGKVPRRALASVADDEDTPAGLERLLGSPSDRAARIALLRQQLTQAVDAEQYEKASSIQAELVALGASQPKSGHAGDTPPLNGPEGSGGPTHGGAGR